jgi:NAD(P)-dependent dehydrogenase (short-subunit alcohol dehydrogenase family)
MSDAHKIAIVIGASGGIGSALADLLDERGFDEVVRVSRRGPVKLDLQDETSIADAARDCANRGTAEIIIDATGFLHDEGQRPEKSLRELDANKLARAFALNATGPALIMKHFLPLLPRDKRAVFATLSAKVGSIGDNRLGGWYGYRASKAALNQFVRTAAVEIARTHPDAVCVAIHPGTVATGLSGPFAKSGLEVQSPAEAASAIIACLDGLSSADTGGFFDRSGKPLPW